MPLSIGVTRWSDLEKEELAAIEEHAAFKARERITWDDWKRKEGRMSFDVPYSIAPVITSVLENLCKLERWFKPCFVPYQFDVNLSTVLPPSVEFWKDELHPVGWEEGQSLTVIEALWVHTKWHGSISEEYWSAAKRYAISFDEIYDKWRQESAGEVLISDNEEFYKAAYHYIEVGLIECLGYGIDVGLPVVIYP